MACSLAVLAALAGPVAAQDGPVRLVPTQYGYTATKPRTTGDVPVAMPPPPPPIPRARTADPAAPPTRTVYYKKDSAPGVDPNVRRVADEPAPAPRKAPDSAKGAYGGKDDKDDDLGNEEPPTVGEVFRLDPESKLLEHVNARRKRDEVLSFPKQPTLSQVAFAGRTFSTMGIRTEPNYLCHEKLLFEQLNNDRYGWEVGYLEPLIEVGTFFNHLINLPYRCLAANGCYDCSAGKCLPGDPVPYLVYPPGFSLSGALFQAGVTIALYAVFP